MTTKTKASPLYLYIHKIFGMHFNELTESITMNTLEKENNT